MSGMQKEYRKKKKKIKGPRESQLYLIVANITTLGNIRK